MSDGEYVVVDLENNSTVESGSQDTAKNVRPRKRKRKLKNKPPPARKNSEHEEEEVEEEDGDAPEGQRFRSGTVTRRLKKPMSVYFEQANVQLLENQGRVTLKCGANISRLGNLWPGRTTTHASKLRGELQVVRSDPLNRVTKVVRSGPLNRVTKVNWRTAELTAREKEDFNKDGGTILFMPHESTKEVGSFQRLSSTLLGFLLP
ncbi:hypothetical protein CYMTET_38218 [Cymbomonas tetramitiformis]|uniref:Calx-beta domain-containing protein n=1 Tax=Cymbomonas tetramitiformis TaxID=36881 RepID=A0AAE0CDW8_9CHLO|nr:hypothetical protein CYMTET_38218 [Cymbomonas tetramitiformis]